MGFTPVSDGWQGLRGIHPLAPRAPITAGDAGSGNDYSLHGQILDQRSVRCFRQPAVHMLSADDGFEDTTGPGGGTGDWLKVVRDLRFTTEEAFTGTLNVAVWCEDCESSGGVYVAVLDSTATTVQDSSTLTNTTSSTVEELTDTLTGLSASTTYTLRVRFAATDGTTTGKLYLVDVRPADLSTSA